MVANKRLGAILYQVYCAPCQECTDCIRHAAAHRLLKHLQWFHMFTEESALDIVAWIFARVKERLDKAI